MNNQTGEALATARRRVRLVDVAREVGVSVQVVSKVLNGGVSNVGASATTQTRIRDTARQMGYRRHAAGMALRNQAFRSIGLLLGEADFDAALPQGVLAGLMRIAARENYSLNVMAAGPLVGDAVRQSRLLNEQMVDVLIIAQSTQPSPELVEVASQMPTPVVWLFRDDLEHNVVRFDEAGATTSLVQHLAQRGAKRVAFVDLKATPANSIIAVGRRAAFVQACRQCDVEPQLQCDVAVPPEDCAAFWRDWLTAKTSETPHPGALPGAGALPGGVIVNCCEGARLLLEVAAQVGVRSPEALRVATFDSGRRCVAGLAPITAAILPEDQFGQALGDTAIHLAEHPGRTATRVIACPLQVGASS